MMLLKLFNELSLHPKNAAELKGLILQLAVQGKLTVNWRTANEILIDAKTILKNIAKGKALIIEKAGVKKEKSISPIKGSDIKFKVPEGWVWVRFASAAYIVRGGSPRPINDYITDDPNGINWIKIGDTKGSTKYIEGCTEKIIPEGIKKSRLVEPGDFILSNSMSFGRPYILKIRGCIHDGWLLIREVKDAILQDYLYFLLLSPYAYSSFKDSAAGGVVQNLNIEKVRQTLIPIPPLKEQHAIVTIVNQLFAEVEQLEQLTKERIQLKHDFAASALQRLVQAGNINGEWAAVQQHFHTFFNEKPNVKKLRETILQLAVQGKLTTHWRKENPGVEPATELLKRITAEKQELIKAGKIKKEKPLPPIKEDEIPFELPEGWVWCRLGDAVSYGTNDKVEPKHVQDDTWVLELEDVEKTTSKLLQKVRFSERRFKSTKSVFQKGDVIYGKLRPYLDKVLIADEDGVCTTEMIPIGSFAGCLPGYLRWFLKSPEFIFYANNSTHGMNLPRLGTEKALLAVYALPPLQEQNTIVATVNTLMALCDALEQELGQQESRVEELMRSCVREVAE